VVAFARGALIIPSLQMKKLNSFCRRSATDALAGNNKRPVNKIRYSPSNPKGVRNAKGVLVKPTAFPMLSPEDQDEMQQDFPVIKRPDNDDETYSSYSNSNDEIEHVLCRATASLKVSSCSP